MCTVNMPAIATIQTNDDVCVQYVCLCVCVLAPVCLVML